MNRLNCHCCIRYLLPHPINNLSYILFVLLYYLILYWAFKIFSTDDVFFFTLKYVWKFENLQTSMFVFFCVISFNTLIYRYIAIVYVYKYVWKHDKPKNGKPVRKHITFVTLQFFEILYCFSFKETSCYLISSCQIISKAIIWAICKYSCKAYMFFLMGGVKIQ